MRPRRRAGAPAVPYLLVCAFVANAATRLLDLDPANFGRLRQYVCHTSPHGCGSFVCLRCVDRRDLCCAIFRSTGGAGHEDIEAEISRRGSPRRDRLTASRNRRYCRHALSCSALDVRASVAVLHLRLVTTAVILAAVVSAFGLYCEHFPGACYRSVAGLFVLR